MPEPAPPPDPPETRRDRPRLGQNLRQVLADGGLWAITLIGVVLRVVVAARSPLWADEMVTELRVSGRAIADLAPQKGQVLSAQEVFAWASSPVPGRSLGRVIASELAESPFHPPLYYTLSYVRSLVVGFGEIQSRLLSIACSALTIPLLFACARSLFPATRGAARLAAVIAALSPYAIRYGAENRSYALLALLTTASLYLHLRVDEHRSRSFGFAFCVVSVLGLYTHPIFLVSLVALALSLPSRATFKRVLVLDLVAVALAVPWAVLSRSHAREAAAALAWLKSPGQTVSLSFVVAAVRGVGSYALPPAPGQPILVSGEVANLAVGSLLCAFVAYGVVRGTNGVQNRLLWLPFLAPFAAILAHDALSEETKRFHTRYFASALASLPLLVAGACFELPRRLRLAALSVLGATTVLTCAFVERREREVAAARARWSNERALWGGYVGPSYHAYYHAIPIAQRSPKDIFVFFDDQPTCFAAKEAGARLGYRDQFAILFENRNLDCGKRVLGGDDLAGLCASRDEPACCEPAWSGEYFRGSSLRGSPMEVREDRRIDFEWGRGGPFPGLVDDFSARWKRSTCLDKGRYTFTTETDDGVRLYVDDKLQIDAWRSSAAVVRQVVLDSDEGRHTIRLEYFERDGNAVARLDVHPTGELPWEGEYFDNPRAEGSPVIRRADHAIAFDWGEDAPDARLPADRFSVRWTKPILLDRATTYRFSTATAPDDGVRVSVDGERIVDTWTQAPGAAGSASPAITADRHLGAGTHALIVEYVNRAGPATARVAVRGDRASP